MPSGSVEPRAVLRIIGGHFRGRRLLYSGDPRTRPMKERLREAIFNLLGVAIRGKYALDLFAGTGALALEALSRGADRATMIEQHHPTAELIRRNVALLDLADRAEVVVGNTFAWWRRVMQRGPSAEMLDSKKPWAVFCSPPYSFYVDRTDETLELLAGMIRTAPSESLFIVEADSRFDFQRLPRSQDWQVREYLPAVVGILHGT